MTDEELVRLPHPIEVGAHGLFHVRESQLPAEQLKEELIRSQHDLEMLIGRPVDRHAYPYGDHSASVVDVAREVYRACYTVTPHLAPARASWTIGCVVVDPDDWPLEHWLKIRGAYRWMGWYVDAKQRANRRLGRA